MLSTLHGGPECKSLTFITIESAYHTSTEISAIFIVYTTCNVEIFTLHSLYSVKEQIVFYPLTEFLCLCFL